MKITETIRIKEETEQYNHIHGGYGGPLTLCGWDFVLPDYLPAKDYPPDCPRCLAIIKYCKSIHINLEKFNRDVAEGSG